MNSSDRIADLEGQINELKEQLSEVRRQLASAELDQWRGRIDDLEVQAHLGSLEARDQLAPIVERLRNAWLDAKEKVASNSGTASEVLQALRDGMEQTMQQIRDTVTEARDKPAG